MSYSPTIDFIALLRQTAGGVRTERMPGLDYVVAAMARAGLFQLYVGQTAPTSNQSVTVWLRPSLPSWVAESAVFLWDPTTQQYELATPALWNLLFVPPSYSFQAVTAAVAGLNPATTVAAIERVAPAATTLFLPPLVTRTNGKPLHVVDWSTNVANHVITLTTTDASTIMRQSSFTLLSTPDQLASATLVPSLDLNGWVFG